MINSDMRVLHHTAEMLLYGPMTDLLIDLPSWCREDTLWSGDHRASSSACNKV